MRTTVRLPDDLLKAAKRRAVETGRTLTDVIEDALRVALAREEKGVAREPVTLPTFGAGGALPGVDLDDTAALLDLMEGRS
jgi:plasmid stability protein